MNKLDYFRRFCELSIIIVNREFNINVSDKTRREEVLFPRYALTDLFMAEIENLDIKKKYGVLIITELFNQERTTIYNSIKQHKNLTKVRFDKYTECYGYISVLVKI